MKYILTTSILMLMILSNPTYAKSVSCKSFSTQAKSVSCKSFSTQAQAQKYYDARKRGWKKLDRDKDGEPCECLRGGSNASKSSCKRWRKKNGKI